MRGERLETANRIAKKRAREWPQFTGPLGRFRKWNRTCDCPACVRNRPVGPAYRDLRREAA